MYKRQSKNRAVYGHIAKYIDRVAYSHTALSSLSTKTEREHGSIYDISGQSHRLQHETTALYSLYGYTKTVYDHTAVYHVKDTLSTLNTVGDVVLKDNSGTSFQVISANISFDDGSNTWKGSVELGDVSLYDSVGVIGDSVTLDILGDTYDLVIVDKSLSKEFNNQKPVYNLDGSLWLLGGPLASFVTKDYITPTLASDVVEYFIGPVTWNVVDWTIPADRLSFVNMSPLSAALEVISAIDAELINEKDGTYTVQSRYKVRPDHYVSTARDYTLSELTEIVSTSEDVLVNPVYGFVRVLDSEASIGDRLEFETTVGNKGILSVYPAPWRSLADLLVYTTSNSSRLALTNPQYKERVEKGGDTATTGELVEIIDGSGSVQYPIKTIDSYTWLSDHNHTISTSIDSTTITVDGVPSDFYGLLRVIYTTRYYTYDVEFVVTEDAQIVSEHTP